MRAVLVCAGLFGLMLAAPAAEWGGEKVPAASGAFLRVSPPAAHPIVGERLSFHGRWFGIPVGSGWIEVKEIVEVEGRKAYHIEFQGRTNDVLSKFYPIHDVVHSYLDVETLMPLRFEKDQREGHYRAHEVVTFDHTRRVAIYRSLLNNSTKEIPLPEAFQDLISALYWLRRQPLVPEAPLTVELYTDEKIYHTDVEVRGPEALEVRKRGTFPCVTVEPKATFKGLLVKRSRIWAHITIDEHRLPVLVKAMTPWGAMSAVLDEASIPSTARRQHHADRPPTRPPGISHR